MILNSLPKNRVRRAAASIWIVFTVIFVAAMYVFPKMYGGIEWYIVMLYLATMFGLTWEIIFNLNK